MLRVESSRCRPAGESDDEDYEEFRREDEIPSTSNNADCDSPQIDLKAQFHKEITAGNLKGVQEILKNGLLIENTDYNMIRIDTDCNTDLIRSNALMTAASLGHTDIVAFLLEEGVNPNFYNEVRFTPLMAVCFSFCDKDEYLKTCAKLLIEHNADLDAVDSRGTTPLMYACKLGHSVLVQELINSGVDVNKHDFQGWTALFWAVKKGNVDAVQLLVNAGAKEEQKDDSGRTAYSLAVSRKVSEDICAILNPIKHRNKLHADGVRTKHTDGSLRTELAAFISQPDHFVSSKPTPKYKKMLLNLFEFLTVSDQELKTLGLQNYWDRRETLEYIKAFHLSPWLKFELSVDNPSQDVVRKKSFCSVPKEKPTLTYATVTDLILGLHSRVVILQASAVYLQRQWEGEQVQDNRTMEHFVKMCSFGMNELVKELRNMVMTLDKMEKDVIFPSDFIRDTPPDEAKGSCSLTMRFIAVSSLVAFAVWKAKSMF